MVVSRKANAVGCCAVVVYTPEILVVIYDHYTQVTPCMTGQLFTLNIDSFTLIDIDFCMVIVYFICDVIWANPAYRGTKKTGSDRNAARRD